MKISLMGALVLTLAAAAISADAKPLPSGGLTAQEVASWLQSRGYKADLGTTDHGAPLISSATQGVNFKVHFYDCKEGRCASIQLLAGFTTDGSYSLAKANDWNTAKRWATATVDEDQDPWLAEDISLSPGGTYENLGDEFEIWDDMLAEFLKTVR